MFEQQPQTLRQRVQHLATQALQQADPYAWFEVLYAEAAGDTAQIPWAKLTPYPYLQTWLQQRSPQGPGKSALVIGCGLGDDAEALAALGFSVTAFDVSPTAIAWCQQRFPNSPVHYQVADLFALDPTWRNTFDLVFECRNLQALPLSLRANAIAAIAPLVAPQGSLVVVTRLRDQETEPDGPPWPLSNSELAQFVDWGLQEVLRQLFHESDRAVQMVGIEFRR